MSAALLLCLLSATSAFVVSPQLRPAAASGSAAAGARVTMMGSTADFKNGLTIEMDGSVWKVTDFLHVKPGKGSAFVRSTLKNLETGKTLDKTWRSGETFPDAQVDKEDMTFSYVDGDQHVFMNMETFEEERILSADIDKVKFIKEEMMVQVLKWNGKAIDVQLPKTVVYKVTEAAPGAKGNTAQGRTEKPATIETGAEIMVPMFIEEGEEIKVDTDDGKYTGRNVDRSSLS